MNFSDRTYPDVVRDLLTVLTRGTVGETHPIGAEVPESIPLDEAPVRRVSHLEGEIEVKGKRLRYRFTERDFELVGTTEAPNRLTALRFRRGGKRPAPNSVLRVNYYPTRLKPAPVNDVNVGSVARTLFETVAFEISIQYQQLQRVYDSAFVETATGGNLDRVVALLDVSRLAAGHPVGKVRFFRRSGAPGQITIPALTAVSDGEGARYLTSEDSRLEPQQSTLEVWVHGESVSTAPVEAGKLVVLERAIAGLNEPTNDEATFRLTEPERDDQLAARARRAIHRGGRGTLDAIKYAVESLSFVSAVTLTEFPEGVPGTLRVDVALTENNAVRRRQVEERVEAYRPAGIFVKVAYAGKAVLTMEGELLLAGAAQPTSVVREITDAAAGRLEALARQAAPGGTLRRARLVAALLEDSRVVDAKLTVSVDGVAAGDTITLAAGKAVELTRESIRFSKTSFEQEGQATTAERHVDVELGVVILPVAGAPTLAGLETLFTGKLGPLLANLQPGQSLAFDAVLDVVRDESRYVIVPATSVVTIEEPSGAFVELRGGDPGYAVPPEASLTLRAVDLHAEAG